MGIVTRAGDIFSVGLQVGFLSDFKWAGYRLAHVFADGWQTASHKRKMTLMEAPTGTLLFYYKDIKQEIVHTLLLRNMVCQRSG